jgi:hypothetical protein
VDLGGVGCHHAGVGIRLLAIGLIAGLLAACSGGGADPDPTPAPTPSTRPSSVAPSSTPATPSRTGPLTTGPNVRPGEKPPVFPELAKQHTANGAVVFGGYYFKALDWVIATNEAGPIDAISAPGCKACARVVAAVETLKHRHEFETGGRIQIRTVALARSRASIPADYVISVVYDEGAVRVAGPGQPPRTTVPAHTNAASLVYVRWSTNRWQVAEVTAA